MEKMSFEMQKKIERFKHQEEQKELRKGLEEATAPKSPEASTDMPIWLKGALDEAEAKRQIDEQAVIDEANAEQARILAKWQAERGKRAA